VQVTVPGGIVAVDGASSLGEDVVVIESLHRAIGESRACHS
jgi:hypothetical protein